MQGQSPGKPQESTPDDAPAQLPVPAALSGSKAHPARGRESAEGCLGIAGAEPAERREALPQVQREAGRGVKTRECISGYGRVRIPNKQQGTTRVWRSTHHFTGVRLEQVQKGQHRRQKVAA